MSNLIPLKDVSSVGPAVDKVFKASKISSTYQLIIRPFFGYEDYIFMDIDLARNKDIITVVGEVISDPKIQKLNKLFRIETTIKVKNYDIKIVLYRPGYHIAATLTPKNKIVVKGKYDLFSQQIEATHAKIYVDDFNEFIPKYNIENLTNNYVQKVVRNIFLNKQVSIYDNVPSFFRKKYELLTKEEALKKLHLPSSKNDIDIAEKRFKYEEALFLHLGIQYKKKVILRSPIKYDIQKVKKLIETISFVLTNDQKKAVNSIYLDYKQNIVTKRLIQGDVGSGKTIVAFLGAYGMILAQKQVVILAPTELLVKQHYELAKAIFPENVNIAFLAHSVKKKEDLKRKIKAHEYDLIIGTTALIEKDVVFADLGLIIVDEQHRFGVLAREAIEKNNGPVDVIYLSATPIPRTLAISLFGDLAVSSIKTMPSARLTVKTEYVLDSEIEKVYQVMEQVLLKGQQIFVVVPAIVSTKKGENIETVFSKIKERFNYPIFVLHGKLLKEEQIKVMEEFVNTLGSILIATTMIEVGIDIKDATMIVIFSAENFGLSQLHQLRGRVGRNNHLSSCYLVSGKDDVERLKILKKVHDGFSLSELDLKERGPGEFIGVKQSGELNTRFLDFNTDFEILRETKKDAIMILKDECLKSHKDYFQINKFLGDLDLKER